MWNADILFMRCDCYSLNYNPSVKKLKTIATSPAGIWNTWSRISWLFFLKMWVIVWIWWNQKLHSFLVQLFLHLIEFRMLSSTWDCTFVNRALLALFYRRHNTWVWYLTNCSFWINLRANAQQPKLFVGMILILIFAEALALYGLIVGIILSSRSGQSRAD